VIVRSLAAGAPVAAAAVVEPVRLSLLGYPVEAGPLIAGVAACLCVRAWVTLKTNTHRWIIDVPVSLLTLLFTVGGIVQLRPAPVLALVIGTGLGAVGVGIIKKAQAWAEKWLGNETGAPGEAEGT